MISIILRHSIIIIIHNNDYFEEALERFPQVSELAEVVKNYDNFNPESCQMKLEADVSLDDLLQKFHYLTKQGILFLGPKITAKNWEKSRPHCDWLNKLIINSYAQITSSEDIGKSIGNLERHWAQKWMSSFINQCSVIIRDFSARVDHQQIIF